MTYRDKWDNRKKEGKKPRWIEKFGVILMMLGVWKLGEMLWWAMITVVDSSAPRGVLLP
jgi:hypothetical protein